jgi:hypothetical protein
VHALLNKSGRQEEGTSASSSQPHTTVGLVIHNRTNIEILYCQITVVMKFGGSSVANAERMREVAGIICSFPEQLPCIVLSAMGKVTPPPLLQIASSNNTSGCAYPSTHALYSLLLHSYAPLSDIHIFAFSTHRQQGWLLYIVLPSVVLQTPSATDH